MLTFSLLGNASVRVTGGAMPVVSFPAKSVAGAINLYAAPQENPNREELSWPGEYDVAGIAVRGIGQLEGQKVSYLADIDHVRVGFPSSPLVPWDSTDIERMGDVQVLVLPAEDAKLCQQLLDEIDPRILIIVPSADGSMNPDMLKACGAADKEHMTEYKLKGSLPADGREVVVLSN